MNNENSPQPEHYMPFSITFANGRQSRAVRVPRFGDPDSILNALQIKASPVIFIIGGAGLMEAESIEATQSIIDDGLARFAEEHQAVIIDGGTAAGVMGQIGNAYSRLNCTFPLVGVAPFSQVEYPGHDPEGEKAPLDASHSHFVLTDGDEFGKESDMIAMLATAISRDQRLPALGMVINGGQIALKEAYLRSASNTMVFPLLVLSGSGRLADRLAEAKRTGQIEENRDEILAILAADVQFLDIDDGADALRSHLETYFTT